MEKEIAYTGQTAAPSDYDCVDGTLAMSMNLWTENGSLKPVLQPKKLFNTGAPDRVVRCVHATSAFKHYIATEIQDDGLALSYFYLDKNDGEYKKVQFDSALNVEVNSISSIGNTLVLLTDEGMMYYLWKDGKYMSLGQHLPDLQLEFSLKSEMIRTDEFTLNFSKGHQYISDYYEKEFSTEDQEQVTAQVLAKVNKFIADESTNKGRFIMPFFVRYAYRLYDGSLTMQSAPILMMCATDVAPQVAITSGLTDPIKARVVGAVHDLQYDVSEPEEILSELRAWSDIITSVDIFISAPLYKYDVNGKCKHFGERLRGSSICYLKNQTTSIKEYSPALSIPIRYQPRTFASMYYYAFYDERHGIGIQTVELPTKKEEDFNKEITRCSNFYFLKSIPIKNMVEGDYVEHKVDVDEDYLQSLVEREVLPDDYDSHDTLVPSRAFIYNSRMNLVGMKKSLYWGFRSSTLFNQTWGYVAQFESLPAIGTDKNLYLKNDLKAFRYTFYVSISLESQNVRVVNFAGYEGYGLHNIPIWFYYPNSNAIRLFIKEDDIDAKTTSIRSYPLSKHEFLNGSYYFGSLYDGTEEKDVPSLTNDTVSIPNKIYTSEVNNPFVFPVTGINTVGTGEILGVSTTTKALSQGQFGQFPLYAFSTDGIWALEVSATGSYSTKQPVSRDVCINADSITQIDNAVLFVTERGIMLISGSEVICLSDMIDSKNDKPFSLLDYKGKNVLIGKDEMNIYALLKFESFLHGCQMLYDDTSRRIIVFNPTVRYAYIYSLNGKAWSMMPSNIRSAVKSYPEALALTYDGDLLDYSKRIPNDVVNNQVIMTRPFKLDMPDVLKTINTIIQRGNFKRGHVQQILYGSRDLINWTPIYSSVDHYLRGFSGTPYKYFQIALKCALSDDESLSGMSVIFTPKLVNQIR